MTASLVDNRQALDFKEFGEGRLPSAIVEDREDWITLAKCRDADPDALFVKGAAQRKAAVMCEDCPVQKMCLADALDHRIEFGVWGGLTERQRRALLRRNSQITNWADHLAAGGDLPGI